MSSVFDLTDSASSCLRWNIYSRSYQHTVIEIPRNRTHLLQNLRPRLVLRRLRFGHPVAHANELSVNVLKTSRNGIGDGLLQLLLDETSGERTQRLVQQIVLRVTDGELQRSDLHVNILDLEHAGPILVRRHNVRRDGEALATQKYVSQARVRQLGEARLLLEVEGNVSHVGLDLAESQHELVVVFVSNKSHA